MYLEKNKKRLLNRNKKEALKKQARKILEKRFSEDQKLTGSNVGIFATTRKNCSCEACGNPRKCLHDITLHEKKYLDKAHPDNKIYWKK